MRNNLLNKDLEVEVESTSERKFATWRTVELAYKIDTHTNVLNRMLPKITEEHVIPKRIKKMKVKYATQIFSKSLSAYIGQFSCMQGKVILEK